MSEYQRLRDERLSQPKPTRTVSTHSAEWNRRRMEARRRAAIVLAARHPEEWRAILAAEMVAVNEERGPLP